MIGKAILMPGDRRRIDALTTSGLEAVKLILGCVPMLLIAGCIEGFVSPTGLPPSTKFAIGSGNLMLLALYLGFAGRGPVRSSDVGGELAPDAAAHVDAAPLRRRSAP